MIGWQVLECQALMPLTLADTATCVVVAGDHLQMAQRVYSSVARDLKLTRSVVERLKSHYSGVAGSPVSIALTRNYRNHPVILRFLSSIFYGGPDVLVPCSQQSPASDTVKPMNFFAAHGEEMQDERSTSWYNVAEVNELVGRVTDLLTNWPAEWGERNAQSILVTSAYNDQVTMCPCRDSHNIGSRIDMQTHAGNALAACVTSNRATVTVFVTV